MRRATVCTPLLAERVAAGRSRPALRVVHTGMGPRRTLRHRARYDGDGPLAVLGVAGGLADGVRVGDVVVASEVRRDGVVTDCPAAALLAGELRRAGFTVHVGPVVTTDRLARGRSLDRLAATGALAVDMESAVVAEGAGDRPIAVVRVISDTRAAGLLRPSLVRDGWRALRTMRRVLPVLDTWAAAAADRRLLLASPRSFCAGVERAIDIVERAVDRYGAPVYVRRQVVHNAHVVADLERRGAVFVEELHEVPAGARVVFAAHGVSPAVRAEAASRDLAVIDATCPLVAKVHSEVRRFAGQGHTVLLIGHGDHEEVVGTVGEAPAHVVVVDGPVAAASVHVPDPARVAYAMQTTLAVDEAESVAAILRDRFPALHGPRSDDICYATSNRQVAVREVAADSELVLVVGSRNSSNSQRLVEVARREGAQAHLVDDAGDIELAWLAGVTRLAVTAGASAPPALVDDIVRCLAGLGAVTVDERVATTESVTFTLPREVS